MSKNKTKQVIVVRSDLKMPKGKLAVQVAHASALNILMIKDNNDFNEDILDTWIKEGMPKIVLQVDSYEELWVIYEKISRKYADIPINKVIDAGITMFNGIQTFTCIGIGPYYSEEIDKFTSILKLL